MTRDVETKSGSQSGTWRDDQPESVEGPPITTPGTKGIGTDRFGDASGEPASAASGVDEAALAGTVSSAGRFARVGPL